MSLPGRAATLISTKAQTLATLASAGIIRPTRPDRIVQVRTTSAMRKRNR